MAVHVLFKTGERPKGGTLSARLVAEVREAVFEKRLKPGDFLGTEKDIAQRANVSRMVARDALRTLAALGVVEIKVGAGGGVRIAHGNPRQFAEALAVQLDLAGITAAEILDAQRAIETLAAELAAEHATAAELAGLKRLLAAAERQIDDVPAFTRACLDFHLAVAEASHNRVLAAQLRSLQHVSWPTRNPALTRTVALHILEIHHKLVALIEARDAAAARRLMDEHIKMIRARRTSQSGRGAARQGAVC
ncbi:MAG: FadR family transcriptional regulator [Alphaproteobacteria bacterium]|nr:FadR family transcriptional regulator [Alphaproteobacteria bacterium]